MADALRLQLFGGFALARGRVASPLPLNSSQKLLALLCTRPGREWHRAELGSRLWPDADPVSARNRIRTAAVPVRERLGDDATLVGDKQTLCLEPHGLEVDLWDARSLGRRAHAASDEAQEREILVALAGILAAPFLPEFEDSWVESERRTWGERAIEASLRLGVLAEQSGQFEAGAPWLEQALQGVPYDERVWAALFRLYARQGRHIEIADRFSLARERLRTEVGGRFSKSMLNLAMAARGGAREFASFTPSQGDLAGRTLARMVEGSPDDALTFLGSDAFRMEVFYVPQLAADLLERVLAATEGWSESRIRCLIFAMIAHSALHNHSRVRELGPLILLHDRDLARRMGAATMLAFAHFLVRDWSEAHHFGEMALEQAHELGAPVGIALARAQIAGFDWHRGEFAKALDTYASVLEVLSARQEHTALAGRAVVCMNTGFVHAILARDKEAVTWFQRGVALASVANHPTVLALALPAQGAVRLALGEADAGAESLSQGLGLAFRQGDGRSLEVALDFAALGLAALGHGAKAAAVVARGAEMRRASAHSRSTAEETLVGRIQGLADGASPDPVWLALVSDRQLVVAILDLLNRG